MTLAIFRWLNDHALVVLFLSGYNFLAMVGAMTPPGVDGGGKYGWFYRYMEGLSPFVRGAMEKRIPGVQLPTGAHVEQVTQQTTVATTDAPH